MNATLHVGSNYCQYFLFPTRLHLHTFASTITLKHMLN